MAAETERHCAIGTAAASSAAADEALTADDALTAIEGNATSMPAPCDASPSALSSSPRNCLVPESSPRCWLGRDRDQSAFCAMNPPRRRCLCALQQARLLRLPIVVLHSTASTQTIIAIAATAAKARLVMCRTSVVRLSRANLEEWTMRCRISSLDR